MSAVNHVDFVDTDRIYCSYWYRLMFDEHFPQSCASTVMRWTPKWVKQTDPSGRAIAIHKAKYDDA